MLLPVCLGPHRKQVSVLLKGKFNLCPASLSRKRTSPAGGQTNEKTGLRCFVTLLIQRNRRDVEKEKEQEGTLVKY